jgi:hypothetical protein
MLATVMFWAHEVSYARWREVPKVVYKDKHALSWIVQLHPSTTSVIHGLKLSAPSERYSHLPQKASKIFIMHYSKLGFFAWQMLAALTAGSPIAE